jgi:hypothetical protein
VRYTIEVLCIGDPDVLFKLGEGLGEVNDLIEISGGLIFDDKKKPIGREGCIRVDSGDYEILLLEIEHEVDRIKKSYNVTELTYVVKADDGSIPVHYLPKRMRTRK